MSDTLHQDPRTRLAREKYFSMRPKPLERWLWDQGLPASAERVFWYHWDLGHRNGTWVSQVALRIVGRDCCLDPTTVTRAYQTLKAHDLIRREDPGRDPANPFQQAVALTEVRIPKALLAVLAREPSRPLLSRNTSTQAAASAAAPTPSPSPLPCATASAAPIAPLDRVTSRAVFNRLSAGERTRFAESSRQRRHDLAFDADTRLSATDQQHVLETLRAIADARPAANSTPTPGGQHPAAPLPHRTAARRLTALEIVRTQRSISAVSAVSAGCAHTQDSLVGEVIYAVEEGALAKFPTALAINIALKKLREHAWTTPNRMPRDWRRHRALPETCSHAGQ